MPSGNPKGSIGSNTTGNVSTGGGGTQSGGAVGTIGGSNSGRDLGRSENSAAGVTRSTTAGRDASYGTKSGGGFGNVDGSKSGGMKSEAAVSKEVADKAAAAAKTASKSQGLKSEAAISREVSKAAETKTGKTASNLDRALAVARGAGTLGQAAPGTKAPSDATISSLKRDAMGSTSQTPVAQKGILGETYSGPKGAGILNTAARYAAANKQGFNAPKVNASPQDIDNMARMMLAESQSISNPMGGILTPGLQAVGDVIRNRILSDQFPDDATSVISQKRQFSPFEDGGFARITTTHPDYAMARDLAESILSGESPSVVGNALNFANLDTVYGPNSTASTKTKRQFSELKDEPGSVTFKDARNPNRVQHTFGTIGESDVAFNQPGDTQTASVDPVVSAFRSVMGGDDLVAPVRATERQAQPLLNRTQLADLSRVVAQPQAPSTASVDAAAAARRGLVPAAGPIPNPPAPQVASAPQTPPTLHPDRRVELAGRRLPGQPLVNTASATAVEGSQPRAIAPGFDQYSPDVQQRIAAALEAVFSDPSRQQDLVPQQTRDYTNMPSRDPSLAGAVAEGADIDEAQAVARGIWGGEPETAQASTGDPVLDAIRDIFGGTPPAEAASPVNRAMKQALDPYGDDPGFMAPNASVRPVPSAPANVPRTPPLTFAGSGQPAQGIAAAIAALGGVTPEQSPSFAKLAPAHAPYAAPVPQPNPMRQQPDAEVASVDGRYTGTAAPRAPEAPPAPALTGIAPSLKTADASGIVGDMMSILGAPKSDAFTPSMPEEPQRSVITPKQSQPRTVDPMRAMIDRAYGDFTRGLDTPAMQADARDTMAAPSSERSVVAGNDPAATTPPGIKPSSVLRDQLRNELRQMERSIIGKPKAVAPTDDMFEGGVRPEAPEAPKGPPVKDGTGFATPGAPLDIDPQRQKNPYGTEEENRFATEEQERDATRMVTKYGPKVDQILEHKSRQFAAGGTRGGGRDNVIRLAQQIRQKQQGLANPDTVTPPEPPNTSGLTNQQIAAILQAIGAAA